MKKDLANVQMPEHPSGTFIRILGESTSREANVGESLGWRIVTHTVMLKTISEPLFRHVDILDEAGCCVHTAPVLQIPPRDADLERFDDGNVRKDWEYEPVVDVDTLGNGLYTVRARLETGSGQVISRAELSVKPSVPAKLLSRIKLCWQIPQADPTTVETGPPDSLFMGGMVRVGDVDGDGQNEIVHAVGAKHICVYRLDGTVLWRYDDPNGALTYNTAAFRVYDIDGDGKAEIITARGESGDLKLVILDGATGQIICEKAFPFIKEIELQALPHIEKLIIDAHDLAAHKGLAQTGHTVRWVRRGEAAISRRMYGCKILLANFRGQGKQDLLVQLGDQNCTTLVAMDNHLNILWKHYVDDGYGGHNPALYDVDGDGKEEVIVGTRLLDHDGSVVWKKPFADFAAPWEDNHIDQSVVGPFGPNGEIVAVYSCRLCVEAATGKTLWVDPTWHGQEVYAAKMLAGGAHQFVFQDREYRHSKHAIHGNWFDVRDAHGDRIWGYRHAALHAQRMLDWDGDGLYEVCFGFDLQRRPIRPNLGIFDGNGRLTCVLPRYGNGADVNNDGYDELISWTQWPDVANTIEIFGIEHPHAKQGQAKPASQNVFSFNELD